MARRNGAMAMVGVLAAVLVALGAGPGLEPRPVGEAEGSNDPHVAAAHRDSSPITRREAEAIARRVEAGLVGVDGLDCSGFVSGSGFLLGDRIVTSRHVVEQGLGAMVRHGSHPTPIGARVAARSDRNDIATLDGSDMRLVLGHGTETAASDHRSTELRVALRDPAVGEPVLVAGWGSDGPVVIDGVIHLYADGLAYGSLDRVMLLDADVSAGFSGGPVVDRRGDVVGMVRAVDEATDLALVIPSSQLTTWMNVDDIATRVATC